MLKRKIAILGTGGTIAGVKSADYYTAGILSVESLLSQVPQIQNLAEIYTEQICNIDSANMSDEIWLKLAQKINTMLALDFDAVVLTHGSDTLEETAYFLNLSLKSEKPVILTAAMRISSDLGSDGIRNLYNALLLALDEDCAKKGVLVTMNDKIFAARSVCKNHTFNVDAFSSLELGDLGMIKNNKIIWLNQTPKFHTLNTPFDVSMLQNLPKVDILYSYSNDGNAVAARAFFENGTKGLVIAGSGAGSIHENHKNTLKELMQKGLKVVVSSRIGSGFVQLCEKDRQDGFISAENLNPQKARVLLALALSKTQDNQEIQKYFLEF